MCGESLFADSLDVLNQGSPPHVWGKHDLEDIQEVIFGITPTCVGKAMRHSSG